MNEIHSRSQLTSNNWTPRKLSNAMSPKCYDFHGKKNFGLLIFSKSIFASEPASLFVHFNMLPVLTKKAISRNLVFCVALSSTTRETSVMRIELVL